LTVNNQIYLSPPDVGQAERDLLLDAFDSNWIAPLGPHVDAFEQEFADVVGVPHAVALSSGTAALHLALLAVGVRPGDTVLTSDLTFVATANAIRYAGAEPIFVDSENTSWNINPSLVEIELANLASHGMLPRAVVVVDICGQTADWDALTRICGHYEIPLVADAAESLGATHGPRQAGAMADVACYSFNGNKIITTSGGGMLVTHSKEWASRVRHLATQARDPARHYQHSQLGYNYRLSNLLAAVGRAQLERLEDRVAKRRAVFATYVRELGDIDGIQFMPEAPWGRSTRWLTCVTLDRSRQEITPPELCQRLSDRRIEARPMWKPMHLQPLYSSSRIVGGDVSNRLFHSGCCLPSGSNLSANDQSRVIDALRDILGKARQRPAA
jgi:dTDP-4-amino-4,6-dideoxygalactose transaminase